VLLCKGDVMTYCTASSREREEKKSNYANLLYDLSLRHNEKREHFSRTEGRPALIPC
jgi:hypothetical protein